MKAPRMVLRSYLRENGAFADELEMPTIDSAELRDLLALAGDDDLLACYPITPAMEGYLKRQGWRLDTARYAHFVEPS